MTPKPHRQLQQIPALQFQDTRAKVVFGRNISTRIDEKKEKFQGRTGVDVGVDRFRPLGHFFGRRFRNFSR